MEYPFSDIDKAAKGYWNSSKAHKDGESADSVGTMYAIQDDSSLNSRLDYMNMNIDSYVGWCSSPPPMTDQLFATFASSSSPSLLQSLPTGYPSAFDSSSFGDYDVMNESYGKFCSEENMFQQMDYSLFHHLPTDSTRRDDDEDDSLCTLDVSKNVSDTGNYNSIIPRSPSKPLSEKMLNALSLFKDSSGVGILAQVWVPIKQGDQLILSTCEQPYLLDQMLAGYREVSRLFTFSVEMKPGSVPGLPGRVFASRVPEWTSNIVHYNKEEYLRMEHAVNHHIRGSIAVPVFEDDDLDNSSCCAVLELVTMKEKPDFDQEMENVCRALQAVNLKSSSPPRFRPQLQCSSKNQTAALSEITDVLRAICHAHKLPLALTWIPCSYSQGIGDETIQVQIRGSNRGSNGKSILCIENTACYVNDREMQGYVLACEEHYLEEGQGVAGKALQSNHPFFFPDVRSYDISEYPLVHHARKFGLNAAVAIKLRSTYTDDDDYILELFLPVTMKGSNEQQLLLNSLAGTMQRICKSLRTVSEPTDGNLSSVTNNMTINIPGSDDVREQASGSKRQQSEKKRSSAEKNVSLSVLQQYFSGSLKDAAKCIGVCPTTLKRICRQHGISRWPSRKINKVNRSLKKIQTVLDSVQGVEGGLKYDPTSGALVAAAGSMPPSKDLESLSPVSAGFTLPITTCGDDEEGVIKGRNQPTSSGMTDSSGSTGQGSSSSSESFGERQNNKTQTGSEEGGSKVSVKATYKEDTIRFKFEASGGCEKLFEEISGRFKLQLGTFQVKYLDDEDEWVMLVTDSDLLECLEILDFVGVRTVKFLVRDISSSTGSSGSSNCFLMGGS
ncbi:protein NLP8-like [Impatiens glandulifera]|uniref:protein NLP8-like n=1 Tax=Impatiens glandulifera TaxID=253017 RepID=UPI001FB10F39|nr:protein NLP8-like [Impatiens glandulifera]